LLNKDYYLSRILASLLLSFKESNERFQGI
jgi:hypothetical protein